MPCYLLFLNPEIGESQLVGSDLFHPARVRANLRSDANSWLCVPNRVIPGNEGLAAPPETDYRLNKVNRNAARPSRVANRFAADYTWRRCRGGSGD